MSSHDTTDKAFVGLVAGDAVSNDTESPSFEGADFSSSRLLPAPSLLLERSAIAVLSSLPDLVPDVPCSALSHTSLMLRSPTLSGKEHAKQSNLGENDKLPTVDGVPSVFIAETQHASLNGSRPSRRSFESVISSTTRLPWGPPQTKPRSSAAMHARPSCGRRPRCVEPSIL